LADEAVSRRLTASEIDSTLAELVGRLGVVGVGALPNVPLSVAPYRHHFSNLVTANGLTQHETGALMEWSEAISLALTGDLPGLLGCVAPATADECVRSFADRFASLAFRRPLSATELALFARVYDEVRAFDEAREAVRALIELTLQSPDFLYLSLELESEVTGDRALFTPYSLASRLSYFLWGTMPDEALLAAAESGALLDPATLESLVRRMLSDTRAARVRAQFHREWLHLNEARLISKEDAEFDAALRADLEHEFSSFVEMVFAAEGGVSELLTSRETSTNARLESVLGVDPVSDGHDDWVVRELESDRLGILARPLYLAATASGSDSLLVHRGVTIVEKLRCIALTPPDNIVVDDDDDSSAPAGGKLAAVEARAEDPLCASCHTTIDPLGIAFESFDELGRHRETYSDGTPIDTSGDTPEGMSFQGPVDLLEELSSDVEVHSCYATKWLEWAVGHTLPTESRCFADSLRDTAATSGIELLVQISVSDVMRYGRVEGSDE
jgi:hypothetical protein